MENFPCALALLFALLLFYFGNEDNVELYVNHTGLMWEAARPLGAALVFAEHRYYGQSKPFAPGTPGCMVRRPPQTHPAAHTDLLTSLSLSYACLSAALPDDGAGHG